MDRLFQGGGGLKVHFRFILEYEKVHNIFDIFPSNAVVRAIFAIRLSLIDIFLKCIPYYVHFVEYKAFFYYDSQLWNSSIALFDLFLVCL